MRFLNFNAEMFCDNGFRTEWLRDQSGWTVTALNEAEAEAEAVGLRPPEVVLDGTASEKRFQSKGEGLLEWLQVNKALLIC